MVAGFPSVQVTMLFRRNTISSLPAHRVHITPLLVSMAGLVGLAGIVGNDLPTKLTAGLAFAGQQYPASHIQFLRDDTWVDANGRRHVSQTIFNEVFHLIDQARQLVLVDMFLFNDFQGKTPETTRALAAELTTRLIYQKSRFPEINVIVITDPINTVYGGLPSIYLQRLREHDIVVHITELDRLPDSNPTYSWLWRLLIKPFGNGRAETLPNPFGDGRVSVRSWFRLFNFKANHRKVLIADQADQWVGLVTSGNPHDGSSAHHNVALRFDGGAVLDLFRSELAVLGLSNEITPIVALPDQSMESSTGTIQVLTEGRIKEAALALIDQTGPMDTVDLMMFYLADRQIIEAFKAAQQRGVQLRLLLDPNKDAFGFTKSGVPNRPVAHELHQVGIPIRWCDTHGEQCHTKMMLVRFGAGRAALLLGSANFTRRNLNNFNLETDVLLRAPAGSLPIAKAEQLFSDYWHNTPTRHYSVEYDRFNDPSPLRYWQYRFQEATGMSSF